MNTGDTEEFIHLRKHPAFCHHSGLRICSQKNDHTLTGVFFYLRGPLISISISEGKHSASRRFKLCLHNEHERLPETHLEQIIRQCSARRSNPSAAIDNAAPR